MIDYILYNVVRSAIATRFDLAQGSHQATSFVKYHREKKQSDDKAKIIPFIRDHLPPYQIILNIQTLNTVVTRIITIDIFVSFKQLLIRPHKNFHTDCDERFNDFN